MHQQINATLLLNRSKRNLAIGMIGPVLPARPDLAPLIQKLLNFEIIGQYMLTEIDHGLDSRQIETTATLLPDGHIDLHTPHPGAAKYMPPVTTISGMPAIGVVFSRLVVEGKFHGIRAVMVSLTDGKNMCKGVSSRMVPHRSGAKSLDHSITFFDHVRLPPGSVIGSLEQSLNVRADFLKSMWRVPTGGLALSIMTIPFLRVGVYIAGKYSLRRMVSGGDKSTDMVPIIDFRTQQLPVLHGLAQIHVLDAFSKAAIPQFRNANLSVSLRHEISTIFKATSQEYCQSTLFLLAERCDAQGLFGYNQIVRGQADMRGACIAEGDILALNITREGAVDGSTSSLPLCRPLVESIGHRMAWEAAVDAGVDCDLVQLYEARAIKVDSSWYVEHGLMNRWEQHDMEAIAADKVLPDLEHYLDCSGVADYATSPILSKSRWNDFVNALPHFVGNSEPVVKLSSHFAPGFSAGFAKL
ncbi:hypothetical protein EV360DRAFT_82793 [Lentinula raphanica]|nr:hypothetical protein EV360DRAFT_82793 [Lentinula raphanica]